jgi:hypothetical protein
MEVFAFEAIICVTIIVATVLIATAIARIG